MSQRHVPKCPIRSSLMHSEDDCKVIILELVIRRGQMFPVTLYFRSNPSVQSISTEWHSLFFCLNPVDRHRRCQLVWFWRLMTTILTLISLIMNGGYIGVYTFRMVYGGNTRTCILRQWKVDKVSSLLLEMEIKLNLLIEESQIHWNPCFGDGQLWKHWNLYINDGER